MSDSGVPVNGNERGQGAPSAVAESVSTASEGDQPGAIAGAMWAAIAAQIDAAGGWIGFDRFMALALYAPGLGYYSGGRRKFGLLPASGSDFVTAPELSPLFGRALAAQVAQALQQTATDELWEFGAGSGALAEQLLDALDAGGTLVRRCTIVELSAELRARQRERLARFGARVRWLDAWPEGGAAPMRGVAIGNELLDAMPVQLLHFDGRDWFERGVRRKDGGGFAFEDRPTPLRPPVEDPDRWFAAGTTIEIHAQAQAFVRTLAQQLERGAAFFIDYGFPEAEYYHPQRSDGTLMCHRGHRADTDPLTDVGTKDITAHVDFTAIALAGQEAGLRVLGYTSQAHFLFNCGFGALLEAAGGDVRTLAHAQKLVTEHEMGELFKVIGFVAGPPFDAIGFLEGDRTHRL